MSLAPLFVLSTFHLLPSSSSSSSHFHLFFVSGAIEMFAIIIVIIIISLMISSFNAWNVTPFFRLIAAPLQQRYIVLARLGYENH